MQRLFLVALAPVPASAGRLHAQDEDRPLYVTVHGPRVTKV
jgi:hypothetical protein